MKEHADRGHPKPASPEAAAPGERSAGADRFRAECERVRAALRDSEERLRTIFEYAPDAYSLNDAEGTIIDSNPAAAALAGASREELVGRNMLTSGIIGPADLDRARAILARGAAGQATGPDEYSLRRMDGRPVDVEVRAFPVKTGGSPLIMVMVREIPESRKEALALLESRRRLETLMGNLPGMAYRCANDREWTMEFISDGCLELTGYRPEDIIGNAEVAYADLILEEDRKWVRDAAELGLAHRRPFQIVYRIRTASSAVKWVWEKGMGIFGEDGALQALEGFITDITERKRAEEAVRTSLAEKEVLLREVHHRVKNNMQIVASLLNLQSQSAPDPSVREIFKESRDRIRSMALVHERLYQSADLARIEFAEYLRKLTSHLVHSYGTGDGRIHLEVDAGNIQLDVNTAVPLGLIVNELVSNAIKHAFPNEARGKIAVGLERLAGGKFRLVVSDDGVGFPEGLDFRNTESLGLQLVTMLADQLEGDLLLERDAGTKFVLTFGALKYKKRT